MSTEESGTRQRVRAALQDRADALAARWAEMQQHAEPGLRITETDLRQEAETLVSALIDGMATTAPVERVVEAHDELRHAVIAFSLRRVRLGATPTATSLAVLALKEALLEEVQRGSDGEGLFAVALLVNRLLDAAGALSFATYAEGREEIIRRQSRQLLELSVPVVRLWHKVLAVPLIGMLDTARAQVVVEGLLQSLQRQEALVVIIDITGVPTVDTAVARHLNTAADAVRLMGAECIISGIRPSIAQNIARSDISLSDTPTRSTLADALAEAMKITQGTLAAPPHATF